MKTFYLTDAGKIRSHNEDSVIITKNQSGDYLMAVADGMGGHSAGEIASSIVITHLSKCFNESFCNMEKSKAVDWIREMATEVNDLIASAIGNLDSLKYRKVNSVADIDTDENPKQYDHDTCKRAISTCAHRKPCKIY